MTDDRASTPTFTHVLDNLPVAVLLFANGRLAHANPVAHDLLREVVPADSAPLEVFDSQILSDAVTETIETGTPIKLELSWHDRDLIVRTSVTDDNSVAVVLGDVTDIRRVEKLRRDFVTNASHELKTPVAGIQALSDSLAVAIRTHPERAVSMVERLQVESQRLSQLVRDLLDLARIEHDDETSPSRRQRVDVAAMVHTQLDRLRPLADSQGIALMSRLPDHATVVGNPTDIRQIVANLLENAVQYNRPGGSVTVEITRATDWLTLRVIDTGVGIPRRDVDRVFERFYRVDKARSRSAGGTGLGLSIVRHAVESHGGTIAIDSEVGQGTTVIVTLPVASDT